MASNKRHEELDRMGEAAIQKRLARRSLIFLEEAIEHYVGVHGVKNTRHYLKYMLDYLEEFESREKGNDDV